MAKPKGPLLSLGARGTIADTLTFQKQGRGHFVRRKPIPKDPKSPAQLARRQIYREAVASWHSLTAEEKDAWRTVCPGLTAYQCFMKSALVPAPPGPPLYIGSEAIDRPTYWSPNYTLISKDGPADGSGTIKTIEIWVYTELAGLIVGTFYTTNGNTFKCRDSEAIPGSIFPGSKVTKEITVAVETGDYIGCFFTGGGIERDAQGYAGLWYKSGEYIDPGDEATYVMASGDTISLYGIGEAAA